MVEKRLDWRKREKGVVDCYNDKHEHLGTLIYERVGKFMHWCWYQWGGIRMSPGCLQEVRDKQKDLLKLKNKSND